MNTAAAEIGFEPAHSRLRELIDHCGKPARDSHLLRRQKTEARKDLIDALRTETELALIEGAA